MRKHSNDFKCRGRESSDKPRKKRVKQFNRNGIEIQGDRPRRIRIINGEVFQ